ncbi:hypothetical protein [Pseudoxanthomonas sp. PXM04]|jgi:hypothetical protein|uniref:hypothetical protein n=1 Tax=Pseudoxanthomonas sp. PXM04 TaxID=2769297 RepID=UPI00177B2CE9|nr:hypothetical protein [Pseudoxanthomonas sp. PXM04]MBD9377940.1 hypothetical protein [Pseudoxanthomonas sp. PXM04]MBD9377953.1 hypothetical protein [Pseudoxanthomonas sp. PXM04]
MAICVALQADGTLVPTGQAVEACTGYVLVSGAEHSFYALVHQAFAVPTPEQAAGWFVGSCGAVMVWFVVARIVGSVASVFTKH